MRVTQGEALAALCAGPTMPVETAGILVGLGRSASYAAARRGDFETIRIGGRLFVLTAPLRRKLGMGEAVAA